MTLLGKAEFVMKRLSIADQRKLQWGGIIIWTERCHFHLMEKSERTARYQPFKKNESVTVRALEVEDECESEIWVKVNIKTTSLNYRFRLDIVKPVTSDAETEEAVLDWHYWLDHGYTFH